MGGKPSGSTTSTQSSQPWGPQQPYLESIFGQAQNLYNNSTPQYYPGQTVAPMTWQQSDSLYWLPSIANGDPLARVAAPTLSSLAQGESFNNPAFEPLKVLANINQANGATGSQILADYAYGNRLDSGNPHQQAVADSVLSEVLPRIQSQFIGGGMLGSPEAARASAAGATSALAPFAFGQYQQEEQNQINSANSLANRFMQGAGLQAQSATNYGNLVAGAYGDKLKAAALAPSVQQTWYTPSDVIFNAGSALQTQNQNQINDAVARWNFEQALPYNQLNQYIGQVTGNYGGTTTLNQPYFNNSGQNALSGAIGGASLGASLLGPAGLGATTAGAGGGIGAGLGALMMLFSDPRLKEDAEPVGKLDNGMTVYKYRYIDDPPEMRRIGLMADEVEREKPEAVARLGPEWGALGGMRMVDYAKATEAA